MHAGFQNIGQAKVGEYAIVKRDLHLTEASMAILLSILEFQEQLADFLLAGARQVSQARQGVPSPPRVDASLSINVNMAPMPVGAGAGLK